jgi:hypothetical protein
LSGDCQRSRLGENAVCQKAPLGKPWLCSIWPSTSSSHLIALRSKSTRIEPVLYSFHGVSSSSPSATGAVHRICHNGVLKESWHPTLGEGIGRFYNIGKVVLPPSRLTRLPSYQLVPAEEGI